MDYVVTCLRCRSGETKILEKDSESIAAPGSLHSARRPTRKRTDGVVAGSARRAFYQRSAPPAGFSGEPSGGVAVGSPADCAALPTVAASTSDSLRYTS